MDSAMTPEQSLRLIDEMMRQAKRSFHRMSYYFLLWGVLLLFAALGEYGLSRSGIDNGWLAWPAAGILGGVVSALHGAKESQRRGASTFPDRVFLWLWATFTITLVLLICSLVASDIAPGPYVSLLTGLPTFVTGAVLRFRPLQLGGVLFWLLGLVALFVLPEHGTLLFAAALMFGYIVPGCLLKRQEDGLRAT